MNEPEGVAAGNSPVRAEPVEAPWPRANVVIGNPPFLGGSKKRRELGDAYFAALDTVFAGRVPGGDLANLTQAQRLPENAGASFEGAKKYGDFDISGQLTRQWLHLPNPHRQSNTPRWGWFGGRGRFQKAKHMSPLHPSQPRRARTSTAEHMPDDEILKRLLALNLARSATSRQLNQ